MMGCIPGREKHKLVADSQSDALICEHCDVRVPGHLFKEWIEQRFGPDYKELREQIASLHKQIDAMRSERSALERRLENCQRERLQGRR